MYVTIRSGRFVTYVQFRRHLVEVGVGLPVHHGEEILTVRTLTMPLRPGRCGLLLCALAGFAGDARGKSTSRSRDFRALQPGLDDLRAELLLEYGATPPNATPPDANPLYVHLHIPKCVCGSHLLYTHSGQMCTGELKKNGKGIRRAWHSVQPLAVSSPLASTMRFRL